MDIMEGNEFDDPDTRTKVFKLLPHLHFLDGVDKDGNDAKSEEDGEEEEELDDEDSGEEEESESDDDDDGPGLSALYDNTANLDDDDEADFDAEAAGDVSSDDLVCLHCMIIRQILTM